MPAMISHAPALGQYQPHIGHVLGAAATAQRMMQSQAWQQQVGLLQPPMLPQPPGLLQPQMILHSQMLFPEQQGGTLGGLTYPTATDGSFSYGMPGGRFMPAEAMAGEGGGQQKQQLEEKGGQKKGGGSRRDMSGKARDMPTLSFFDAKGGYTKVCAFACLVLLFSCP